MYAAITGTAGHVFASRQEITACAEGNASYPWECKGKVHAAFQRSRIRTEVCQCLSRDPATRPTAGQLAHAIDRISNATSTHGEVE